MDETKKTSTSFNPEGRPTLYDSSYHDDHVYRYCLLGATDKELSKFFGISEQTLNVWKKKHTSFSESMQKGKCQADAQVAEKLFQRALGYKATDIKFATHEGVITDQKEYVKEYPPEVKAATFWLKNRQPEKWREKIEIDSFVQDERRPIEYATAEEAARAYNEEIKKH